MRSSQRWKWTLRSRPDPQSLPRLRALVAHEDRLLHRASSATPTLALQWYQVTSFEFHFSWERPQGCIIPRSRGSVPAACIPFAYVFSLPCWGRPSGCIIPKPLGPDPVACIFLHLPKLICLSCVIYLWLSPARLTPAMGRPLSLAIRLRVKRGAPEHRDSGALTGSPALTPWP